VLWEGAVMLRRSYGVAGKSRLAARRGGPGRSIYLNRKRCSWEGRLASVQVGQ
jgi:hypothetical protein